jgi:hypothetical protein
MFDVYRYHCQGHTHTATPASRARQLQPWGTLPPEQVTRLSLPPGRCFFVLVLAPSWWGMPWVDDAGRLMNSTQPHQAQSAAPCPAEMIHVRWGMYLA